MAAALEFFDEPGAFLEAAHELLADEPVEATVVATVSARLLEERRSGLPAPEGFPLWWVVERDAAGRVVGAGMRTAPIVPHPVYLMRMQAATARLLARRLHERGELIGGVNGSRPAVEKFAAETARLRGCRYRVQEHTRLFVLGDLQEPPVPLGRPRPARPAEADQVIAWHAAFARDAAVQAGRSESHPMEAEDPALMLRRIEEGSVWVWEDERGVPVHLTGASRPMFGVSRVGPVYTPAEHRGRGYAGATVAALSRALQEQGARVCLFTDQANPVSNALYERLGFRRLVDQANLVIE